jgi:hypothetical protein
MDDLSGRRPEAALAAGVVSEALNLALGERGSVHVKPGRDVVTDADVAAWEHVSARCLERGAAIRRLRDWTRTIVARREWTVSIDSVGVAQLMRRQAPARTGGRCGSAELGAGART